MHKLNHLAIYFSVAANVWSTKAAGQREVEAMEVSLLLRVILDVQVFVAWEDFYS